MLEENGESSTDGSQQQHAQSTQPGEAAARTIGNNMRCSSAADVRLSTPLQELLQETYFTCMFNSTLIFHRPTFQQAFEEGRLPSHVLLAVYATATM